MDIMYSVLQYQDIAMDLPQAQPQDAANERVAMESLAVDDKRFTAEHILHICKFLAEKSKRKKSLYQQQQSARKLKSSVESVEGRGGEIQARSAAYTESRLRAIPAAATTSLVLTAKPYQAPAANRTTCTPAPATITVAAAGAAPASCSLQYSVGKRDILLKIRRQIFERKRQRQLAHVQQPSDVWRPW